MNPRLVSALIVFAAALAPLCSTVCAQTIDKAKADAVKSAYVLNFIKFTDWPDSSFENQSSPIVVSVLGEGAMENTLENVMRGADPVDNRRIVVRRLNYPRPDASGRIDADALAELHARLRSSHVVFLAGSEQARLKTILSSLEAAPVLTVSDVPGFSSSGGMLGLVLAENRITFEANPDAIQKSQLSVSAKVLKLARIVRTGDS